MRIAYFAHASGGSRSGVFQKIAAQVDQWRTGGHLVCVFIATRDDPAPWLSRLGDCVVGQYASLGSRMRAMVDLVRAMRSFDPNVAYLRWDLFYPQMVWFPAQTPLVVEVNSDDLHEYALGSRARSVYNSLTRDVMLMRARALVFVTSELSRCASFARYPGRHLVVSNGIDLAAYPEPPAVEGGPLRVAFVGSDREPWHGVDKLMTLAAMRPDWCFDIVGPRNESRTSPPNILWHGSLERAEVLSVLAKADVGVGTLALHRKLMTEACPLKVREYLAIGLPVLYAYSDADVDSLGPWCLRIANTESNIVDEIDRIDAFVRRSRGTRIPRPSVAHIDLASKEQQRLRLFDDLAGV